jgi:hypothetical protein
MVPQIDEEMLSFFKMEEERKSSSRKSTLLHSIFFSILRYLPFLIPFEKRVELFHELIADDKLK